MNAPTSPAPAGTPVGKRAEQVALSEQLVQVAKCLNAVLEGRSLSDVLPSVPTGLRPGVQALTFHALRHWGTAAALVSTLTDRPPAPATRALLGVALTLLMVVEDADAPSYTTFTVVDQAVVAARSQRSTSAHAGLVNACLRRFLREESALLSHVLRHEVAQFNHPVWWVQRVRHDHPRAWPTVLAANQRPAALVLRVNPVCMEREHFLQHLAQAGIAAHAVDHPAGASAVVLERHVAVERLPGYAQGWFSVQDVAAQWAAQLLLTQPTPSNGQPLRPLRVLDACAAPGGKTAHLLEQAHVRGVPMALWALEVDIKRNQRMHDNLMRLGWAHALAQGKAIKAGTLREADAPCSLRLRVADATAVEDWWDGQLFDAILLDAPCTASGIVRRHPDVRWLRRESDVMALSHTQQRLLEALWPLLRPGGRLVYATCSVFKAEGADQVNAFVERHRDVRLAPSPGHLLPGGGSMASTLPDNLRGEHDGFFYATLDKVQP